MLLKFIKCLIQSIKEAMIQLERSLLRDLLFGWSYKLLVVTKVMFLVIKLESYILLLIQIPNKKQSRNFRGFQFVKHMFCGGDFFVVASCDSLLGISQK